MFSPTQLLVISHLFPILALSSPLTPADTQTLASNPSSLLTSLATQNSTIKNILQLNPNITTVLRDSKIDCDQRRFGNPPAASCKDAIDQIPHDPATVIHNLERSYGPRGGIFDVRLPKRFISCTLLPLNNLLL